MSDRILRQDIVVLVVFCGFIRGREINMSDLLLLLNRIRIYERQPRAELEKRIRGLDSSSVYQYLIQIDGSTVRII